MSEEVARYTCYRTDTAITVDGRLDEAAWLAAPMSNSFVDIVTGEPALVRHPRARSSGTTAFLYFGFYGGRDRCMGHADRARFEDL